MAVLLTKPIPSLIEYTLHMFRKMYFLSFFAFENEIFVTFEWIEESNRENVLYPENVIAINYL